MAATRIRQDSPLAEAYVPYAKNLARQHRRYMEISGVSAHRQRFTLHDGTVITVNSAAGIDDISITPALRPPEELVKFEEEILDEYGVRPVVVWMDYVYKDKDKVTAGLKRLSPVFDMQIRSDGLALEYLNDETSAVIIIGPTRALTGDEATALKDYIDRGGRLLFFFESSWISSDRNEILAHRGLLNGMMDTLGIPLQYDAMYQNYYLWSEDTGFPNDPILNSHWSRYTDVSMLLYSYWGTAIVNYHNSQKLGLFVMLGITTAIYPKFAGIIGAGGGPSVGEVLYSDPNSVPLITSDVIAMNYRTLSTWPMNEVTTSCPDEEYANPEHWAEGIEWDADSLAAMAVWKKRPFRRYGMWANAQMACYGNVMAFACSAESLNIKYISKVWRYTNKFMLAGWLSEKFWPRYNSEYPYFLGGTYPVAYCPSSFNWIHWGPIQQ